jgi:hypothetical protein
MGIKWTSISSKCPISEKPKKKSLSGGFIDLFQETETKLNGISHIKYRAIYIALSSHLKVVICYISHQAGY